MEDIKCDECLFVENCTARNVCDFFTPTSLKGEEDYLSEYIELQRIIFRDTWQLYEQWYS